MNVRPSRGQADSASATDACTSNTSSRRVSSRTCRGPSLRATRMKRARRFRASWSPFDQTGDPGAIDIVNPFQVDHHPAASAVAQQLEQRLPQARRGRHVHVTGHLHNRCDRFLADVDSHVPGLACHSSDRPGRRQRLVSRVRFQPSSRECVQPSISERTRKIPRPPPRISSGGGTAWTKGSNSGPRSQISTSTASPSLRQAIRIGCVGSPPYPWRMMLLTTSSTACTISRVAAVLRSQLAAELFYEQPSEAQGTRMAGDPEVYLTDRSRSLAERHGGKRANRPPSGILARARRAPAPPKPLEPGRRPARASEGAPCAAPRAG